MAKRWRKGRKHDDGDDDTASPRPRKEQRSSNARTVEPEPEDLATRLGAAGSAFQKPPTAEELRAAFSRKKVEEEPAPRPADSFSSRYSAESLFSSTPEPSDEEFVMAGEDRSRTSGDYYYDPADAWGVLGLQPGASWKDITSAHRRMAMVHHPDRMVDASDEERARAEETMRDINVAYSVLRRLTGH